MFGPPDQALKGPKTDLFGYLGVLRFGPFFGGLFFLGGVPDGTRVRILSTCLRPETKTRAKSRSGKNEKISLFWSLKIAETIIYVAFERFSVERKTGPKSIVFRSE